MSRPTDAMEANGTITSKLDSVSRLNTQPATDNDQWNNDSEKEEQATLIIEVLVCGEDDFDLVEVGSP